MNLKIMRLVLRVQYSRSPAAPAGELDGVRLTVDRLPQIPRRTACSRLNRGLTYRDGLRLDLLLPVTAGPHPLVVYVPGGGFVVAPRRMARRQRACIAAAGYAVASVEYRTTRQQATYSDGMADIQSAITYLSDHADEFAINAGRIGIWASPPEATSPAWSVSPTGASGRWSTSSAPPTCLTPLTASTRACKRRSPTPATRSTATVPSAPIPPTSYTEPPRRSCCCTETTTESSPLPKPDSCTVR
jgi:BD-FAE protein